MGRMPSWNSVAASTASAPCPRAYRKWASRPAPPEAMRGMGSSEARSSKGRSKPSPVPSRSMEVSRISPAPASTAWVGCSLPRLISSSVGTLLALEDEAGLHTTHAWEKFRARVYENRDRFMEFICKVHREGELLVGNSCPGRASTLLNFYGVTPDLMPYIGELATSLKLGLYVPGKHIPVVNNRRIIEDQPKYLVLLAWHYADFIVKRLRSEGVKSTLLTALPDCTVLQD